MSVNNTDGASQPVSAPQPATTAGAAPAAAATAAQATQRPRPKNAHDFGRMYGRTYSTNKVSETVAAINTFFNEDIQNRPEFAHAARTIILDGNEHALQYSCIVLTYASADSAGNLKIPAHVMIVAGSAPAPTPLEETREGRPVTIRRVPGDINGGVSGNKLWAIVTAKVREVYGSNVAVYDAGTSVLPEELTEHTAADISKREQHRLISILSSAFEAVVGITKELFPDDFPQFNADAVKEIDAKIQASIDPNPSPAFTSAGLPIRSDIGMRLELVDNIVQQGAERTSVNLAQIDGYIDVVYQDPDQTVALMPNPPTQRLAPRLIITSITNFGITDLKTQLFAINATRLLANNYQWALALKPSFGDSRGFLNGVNIRDIGAVGYDLPESVNNGKHIPLKPGDDQAFLALIHAGFKNELWISLDIEETGENSWVQQTLMDAAYGDQQAYARVIKAANDLTMGHFAQVFQPGAPVFIKEDNTILLGYYSDKDGALRDKRDFDYLAAQNVFGPTDITTAVEYDRTYDAGRDSELRLDIRTNIEQSVLGNSMTITGRANRGTFAPEFLAALGEACARAGLTISPGNLTTLAGSNVRRNAAQYQNYGISGTQAQAGFSYNTGRGAGNGAYHARNGAFGRLFQ